MPKGVRHGEERHVVHSLPLEESLSKIYRLIPPPSPGLCHELVPTQRGREEMLPLGRRCGRGSVTTEIAVLPPPAQQGAVSEHKEKKQTKNPSRQTKLLQAWKLFIGLSQEKKKIIQIKTSDFIFALPQVSFLVVFTEASYKLQLMGRNMAFSFFN